MVQAKKPKKKAEHHLATVTPAPTPIWPPLSFNPDLNATTLVRSQICTISGLFSTDECYRFVRSLNDPDRLGAALKFETTSAIPKRGEAFRFNDRISVYDPGFAQALWRQTGLQEACLKWLESEALIDDRESSSRRRCWGLNPNVRIYRYRPGHKFEQHYDDSVRVSTTDGRGLRECLQDAFEASEATLNISKSNTSPIVVPKSLTTEYTLLIYLTGYDVNQAHDIQSKTSCHTGTGASSERKNLAPFKGGETVFYATGTQPRPSSSISKPANVKTSLANTKNKKGSNPNERGVESCNVFDESIVASVQPIAGLALLHRHGNHCLLHEGREVLSGEKYVLRSDLIFG